MFVGELSIYTDDPEDVHVYPLKLGKCTIGSSLMATIRIGTRMEKHIKDIHCVIDVDKDGLVTVTNKAPLYPVKIGSQSVFKPKLLKSGDIFSIDIYNFQYKGHTEHAQVLSENRRITPRKRRMTLFEPRLLGSQTSTPFNKKNTPRSGTPGALRSVASRCYGSKENNNSLVQKTLENESLESPKSIVEDDIHPLRRSMRGRSSTGMRGRSSTGMRGRSSTVICNTSKYSLISNDDTVNTPEANNGRNTRHSRRMISAVDTITMDRSLPSEAELSSSKLGTEDLNTHNSSVMLIDFSSESDNLPVKDKTNTDISLECFDVPNNTGVSDRRTRSFKMVSTNSTRKVPLKTCYTEPRRTKFNQKKISLPGKLTTPKTKFLAPRRSCKQNRNLFSVSVEDVTYFKDDEVRHTEEMSTDQENMSSPKQCSRKSIINLENGVNSSSQYNSMIFTELTPRQAKLKVKCVTEPRNKKNRLLKKSLPLKLNNLNDSSILSFSMEPGQCNEALAEVSRMTRKRGRQSMVQSRNESIMDVCSDSTLESTNSDSFMYIPNQSNNSSVTKLSLMNNSKAAGIISRTKERLLRKIDSSINDQSNISSSINETETPKVSVQPNNNFGSKKLQKTPRVQKEPKNDLTKIVGVKRLLRTPRVQKGPKNDLTNVTGVKMLFGTPKLLKEPNNDLTNPIGIKKLLATPRPRKEPLNDLTNPVGVKKLLKTPKVQKEPKNDLSNVAGVKKLLKTPIVQKEPKNDLSNPLGLKKLMTTPKLQKEPNNDLSNPIGLKNLLATPKVQREPKNDLTNPVGVKKLMRTPKIQGEPHNDLRNVAGIKNLMKTPKIQKDPKNDLTDVFGVKKLLRTPKPQVEQDMNLSDFAGVQELFNMSLNQDEEKVFGPKTLIRTYSRQNLSPVIPLMSNEGYLGKRRGRPSSLPGKSELNSEEPIKSLLDTSVAKSESVSVTSDNKKRRKRGRPSSLPSSEPTNNSTGIRTRRRGAPVEISPTGNKQEDTIEECASLTKRGRSKKGTNVKNSKKVVVSTMEQSGQENLESKNEQILPYTIQEDLPSKKRGRRIASKKETDVLLIDESIKTKEDSTAEPNVLLTRRTRRQNKEVPIDISSQENTSKVRKNKKENAQTKKGVSIINEPEEIPTSKRSKRKNDKNTTDKEEVSSPKRSRKKNIPTEPEHIDEEIPTRQRSTRAKTRMVLCERKEEINLKSNEKARSSLKQNRKKRLLTETLEEKNKHDVLNEEKVAPPKLSKRKNVTNNVDTKSSKVPTTKKATRRNKGTDNEADEPSKITKKQMLSPENKKQKTTEPIDTASEENIPRTRSGRKRL